MRWQRAACLCTHLWQFRVYNTQCDVGDGQKVSQELVHKPGKQCSNINNMSVADIRAGKRPRAPPYSRSEFSCKCRFLRSLANME